MCELENAPETQKCPKTFVHDCRKDFLLCIVLFAKNCTNQIKSNYLNSHGEEAQEKPPGL